MERIENTIEHIGSKIKYYRLLNKISLSKLAEEANISKSTLFGLEEGKSNPTISTLLNIASTLEISLNELIGSSIDSVNSSNLTLISTPEDEQYKLYKLTLSPNELFKLKETQSANIEIEIIEGAISLIDKSTTLYAGESIVVNYNQYFKALNSGAVAIIKIYKLQESFYIKEDIFHKEATPKLLENIIKNSRKKLISRAVFTSIAPIEDIKTEEYMNYIEFLSNKESYYYIYRRYQGLMGGVNSYLNSIDATDIKESNLYKNLEEFLNLAISKMNLTKNNYQLLNTTPLSDVKDILIEATREKRDKVALCISIFDIEKRNLKDYNYILLIEELSNEIVNKDKLTLTLKLYRALESLYIVDESTLNNNELKLFNKIINVLPKALYFSYTGYTNIAINCIKTLIEDRKKESSETKFDKNYIEVLNQIEAALEDYENGVELSTINIVESIAKDLNFNIETKELIAPVIGDSGLYAYLFKINK